jgi:hypothetical protein
MNYVALNNRLRSELSKRAQGIALNLLHCVNTIRGANGPETIGSKIFRGEPKGFCEGLRKHEH